MGLTDSSTGNKDNSYDYDPYGQMKAQQEGEVNPWKFASGFYDSSTKLYHFGARYYDPKLGRWTQQDPVGGSLGDLNSANRYVYAGDDPVNVTDPKGSSVLAPYGVIGFFPLASASHLVREREAQEVASGLGWAIAIAIFALLPAPFSVPADLIVAGVTAYEPACGSRGVIVFIYFGGDPGFECG